MIKLLKVNDLYFASKGKITNKIYYPSFEYAIIDTKLVDNGEFIYTDYLTMEEYEFVYSCVKPFCNVIGKRKHLSTITDKKIITRKKLIDILDDLNKNIKNDSTNKDLLYLALLYYGTVGKKIDSVTFNGNNKRVCLVLTKDGRYKDINTGKIYEWFYNVGDNEECVSELRPLSSKKNLTDQKNMNGFIKKEFIEADLEFEKRRFKLERKNVFLNKKENNNKVKIYEFKKR